MGIRERSKIAELIPVNIIWTVWNERNKRVSERVDDVNAFNILKNRWFYTLIFCY